MKKVKRLFLENASEVELDDQNTACSALDDSKEFTKLFKVITDLDDQVNEKGIDWLIEEVQSSDEIWVATSYVGNSGRLFSALLEVARGRNWTSKKIINCYERIEVGWWLDDHQKQLISYLKDVCSFQFIYKDDSAWKELLLLTNTDKQILAFLKKNVLFTSPTEVGLELGKNYDQASTFACRYLKRLHVMGLVEKGGGKYRYKKGLL